MQHITPEELAKLKDLLKQVSQGPWVSFVEGRDHTAGDSFIKTGAEPHRGEDIYLAGATPADQDFIAAARQDMPRLIAEIERLQAKLRGQQAAAE